MTDFKGGGIPTPDYDTEDINYISQKTEFTEDVFIYGKLYAEFGGNVQSFRTAGVERLRITKTGSFEFKSGTESILKLKRSTELNEEAIIGYFSSGLHIETRENTYLSLKTNQIERVQIDSKGQVIFKPMTETERDALTAVAGGVIYNSTTNKLQCYNGSSWNNLF